MRNSNLDFAKAIACMGVVIMHCSFPGVFGKFALYLFKFAVPLFFMVSGYFLFRPELDRRAKLQNLKRKARHILWLLISAECLSAVYFVPKAWIVSGSYETHFAIGNIVKTCFVGSFFNGTLWFLYALFWSYILIFLVVRYVPRLPQKISYVWIGLCIFLVHIVARVAIRHYDFYDVGMFRNAILYGIPFILMGYGIRKAEAKSWYKNLSVTRSGVCIGLFVVGYVISVGEYAVTRTSLDIYVGTILSTWALFTYCVSASRKVQNQFLIFVGEKLSLYVYVVHFMVIDLLSGISGNTIYLWCLPILAIAVSLLVSYAYYFVKQVLFTSPK